ncbi:MAG: lactate racemase domain-containing protein [Desulfotignum sp.]|nr:lactate racemase domain-containing protein [Desulfotignum sp.]
MFRLDISERFAFPDMFQIHWHPQMPPAMNVAQALESEWSRCRQKIAIRPGDRIAVGVGSRSIPDLPGIVASVVTRLKNAGAEPFILPAMGSHGGGTPQGQTAVLAELGVVEPVVGAPVMATMDVVYLGRVEGIPLYMNQLAYEADGLVLINRVKPHTDFTGPVESGVIKMLVIGLGNQKGADGYHKAAVEKGFSHVLMTIGRHLLSTSRFLFGVALVENRHHAVCEICLGTAQEMEPLERRLLKTARTCLPALPMDAIDLLIVDEMGKDISGAGLDPNVIGGKGTCIWSDDRPVPDITRIFVRDLTKATEGNAMGLGRLDVATRNLVDKIDMQTTAVNAITACCPEDCKIPLTLATEKQAVAAALMTLRPYTMDDLKVVHIKNTRDLTRMCVSRGCLPELTVRKDISIVSGGSPMGFDTAGRMAAQE